MSIVAFINQQGHSPTLKEIGDGVAIKSKGTVHRYVSALKNKGVLQHNERQWRGLSITEAQDTSDSSNTRPFSVALQQASLLRLLQISLRLILTTC